MRCWPCTARPTSARTATSALFFGLSGTGKTTLSADPKRRLIGDDEHGWSSTGVFNFEGGCYAKVIRLSAEHEPEIYATTRRFGTILENVVQDPTSRRLDLDDDRFTENTRAAYPLDFIPNVVPEGAWSNSHPKNVILLTCDAQGVLPPIARLDPEHVRSTTSSPATPRRSPAPRSASASSPRSRFRPAFGAPFMVHHPFTYADLLRAKMLQHGATCWLVNTGWVGGGWNSGKRISIRHTRNLLNAALEGKLDKVSSSGRTGSSASRCHCPAPTCPRRYSTPPPRGATRTSTGSATTRSPHATSRTSSSSPTAARRRCWLRRRNA